MWGSAVKALDLSERRRRKRLRIKTLLSVAERTLKNIEDYILDEDYNAARAEIPRVREILERIEQEINALEQIN